MPQVTVLMTIYNAERYLKAAMNSLLRQTFSDCEFLCVDDCSRDKSLEILRSYADPRIRVHRNEQNLGQTRSLNVGLRLAGGQYIARMDADDLAFPHWLETQINFLKAHPEVSVASTKAAVIDEHNRLQRVLNSPVDPEELVFESMFASPINHVGSVSKREELLRFSGYDENFRITADYDLWSRMLMSGQRLASTERVGVAIRFHAQNISRSSGSRDCDEASRIMQKNIRHWANLDVPEEKMRPLWQMINDAGALSAIDFEEALGTLSLIYEGIQKNVKFSSRLTESMRESQAKVIFMKRVFAAIAANDAALVRRTCDMFRQRYGFSWIFQTARALTIFGMGGLRSLPFLYENLSRLKTRKFRRDELKILSSDN